MTGDDWYHSYYDIFVLGLVHKRAQVAKDGSKVTTYVALGPYDASGRRRVLGWFSTEEEARQAIKRAAPPDKFYRWVIALVDVEQFS